MCVHILISSSAFFHNTKFNKITNEIKVIIYLIHYATFFFYSSAFIKKIQAFFYPFYNNHFLELFYLYLQKSSFTGNLNQGKNDYCTVLKVIFCLYSCYIQFIEILCLLFNDLLYLRFDKYFI